MVKPPLRIPLVDWVVNFLILAITGLAAAGSAIAGGVVLVILILSMLGNFTQVACNMRPKYWHPLWFSIPTDVTLLALAWLSGSVVLTVAATLHTIMFYGARHHFHTT